jgi:hypothetical protein
VTDFQASTKIEGLSQSQASKWGGLPQEGLWRKILASATAPFFLSFHVALVQMLGILTG